jgi:hypothetical protein
LLNHLEVLSIGNEAVFVLVDLIEDLAGNVGVDLNFEEIIGQVDEVGELLKGHLPLTSMGNLSGPVLLLQAHLSAVSLEEEIAELIEGDGSAVVDIQPEEVLNDIVPLASGLLMEHIHDKSVDIVAGELSLLVLELGELDLQTVPNTVSQSYC